MFSAGEHSGDLHGAYLVRALKKIIPNLELIGMGGPLVRKEGVSILFDLIPHGTIGISEAVREAKPILYALKKMQQLLEEKRPDALILIDYQGFNMTLVNHAKKLGIPSIYYISPMDWIWQGKKGIKKIATQLDILLSIYEKEAQTYREAGGNAIFIGHPYLDILPDLEKELPPNRKLEEGPPKIGIFPGSRMQEIQTSLPIQLEGAQILKRRFKNAHFYLPVSADFIVPIVKKQIAASPVRSSITLLEGLGESLSVLKRADLNLMTSGSISLEGTLFNAPMILCYRLSLLSYFIGKYLLRLNVPFIGLPNIILGEKVVPELIQNEFSSEKLANLATHLLTNPQELDTMKKNLGRVREKLGTPGAPGKAAHLIKDFLHV